MKKLVLAMILLLTDTPMTYSRCRKSYVPCKKELPCCPYVHSNRHNRLWRHNGRGVEGEALYAPSSLVCGPEPECPARPQNQKKKPLAQSQEQKPVQKKLITPSAATKKPVISPAIPKPAPHKPSSTTPTASPTPSKVAQAPVPSSTPHTAKKAVSTALPMTNPAHALEIPIKQKEQPAPEKKKRVQTPKTKPTMIKKTEPSPRQTQPPTPWITVSETTKTKTQNKKMDTRSASDQYAQEKNVHTRKRPWRFATISSSPSHDNQTGHHRYKS